MKIKSIERIWVDLPLKEVPWQNMVREIPHWSLFDSPKGRQSKGDAYIFCGKLRGMG